MKSKAVSISLAVMVMTLAVSASALADCQKKQELTVMAAGAAIDASGTAEVRAQRTRQRFKVSIDARVPDGTTFLVFANGSPAGSITIELGAGQLELTNDNGKTLPAGVSPVCGIGSVAVVDGAGATILQTNF